MPYSFLLTGGGTGGHVFPALAVGQVLRERGHRVLYAGRSEGIEGRLVPEAGFDFAPVRSGALNRVGWRQQFRTSAGLPTSLASAWKVLQQFRPRAVFSMGGFVAGPVMLAALLRGVPLVVMEPNAVPGAANRWVARRVYRALLGFAAAAAWFPRDRVEITGLPVRAEFFHIPPAPEDESFTLLITGGSRGARTLNRAARESWPLFRKAAARVRMLHQTGAAEHEALAEEFSKSGMAGCITPFLSDMPSAFSQAHLVVARAGAGSVNELAAAGMPSVLVPFPFASDDHQKKNAEALAMQGAARLIPDSEMTGERLFHEVEHFRQNPRELVAMRERVRQFARPGAAARAAAVLEEAAERRKS